MQSNLISVLEDLEPALKNKNPQVKEGTLKFLGRCLATSKSPIPQTQIKPLAENLAILLEDSFEGARNEAATCLGTLMKMVGERPLNATMENIADVRKAKVKEAFEKATVKCKSGSTPASRAPASTAKKVAPTKVSIPESNVDDMPLPKKKQSEAKKVDTLMSEGELPKKPIGKPPARLQVGALAVTLDPALTQLPQAKKGASDSAATTNSPALVVVKKAPPPAAAGKSKQPAPPSSSGLDTFKYKHTPEDAENLAAELIPANIATDFSDANWKVRLAALEEMASWVEKEVGTLDAEVVVRFIAKKGWAEKNFQV
jgi:cytoskeleton-associated protein 5